MAPGENRKVCNAVACGGGSGGVSSSARDAIAVSMVSSVRAAMPGTIVNTNMKNSFTHSVSVDTRSSRVRRRHSHQKPPS
jgi:hypothetical protein